MSNSCGHIMLLMIDHLFWTVHLIMYIYVESTGESTSFLTGRPAKSCLCGASLSTVAADWMISVSAKKASGTRRLPVLDIISGVVHSSSYSSLSSSFL